MHHVAMLPLLIIQQRFNYTSVYVSSLSVTDLPAALAKWTIHHETAAIPSHIPAFFSVDKTSIYFNTLPSFLVSLLVKVCSVPFYLTCSFVVVFFSTSLIHSTSPFFSCPKVHCFRRPVSAKKRVIWESHVS